MKLNLLLVLSALFAYSECMNLSPATQDSILKILHNQSGITDPKNFLGDFKGLERTLSQVGTEGSTELAEIFVRAYNANELSESEILSLLYEAARVGNTNVFIPLSQKISYRPDKTFEIALLNGHLDIVEIEYLKMFGWAGDRGEIAPEVVRAGQFKSLRWLAEKGDLTNIILRKSLIAALETDKEEMLEFLLSARTYIDRTGIVDRFTYEEALSNGQCPGHEKVLIKAAEVGNMTVIQYFLERNLLTTPNNLSEAQKAAAKNGHPEIAELIDTWRMVR